ncbi:helix-turn-helix transcriptional regulator [Streptomyces sp. NPDC005953]|uniref:helix-turn-helix domain-containing protein n=1 Tax=Streptomyces sp. NPDC005953 TaxID=3156719 RepID=UPI0033E9F8E6
MPPRDNPTTRQIRLGAELRKLREAAGRTAREAAALLSIDQTRMSHTESGRVGITEERLRRLATFYQCDDDRLIDSLCGIAKERRGQFWFDEYRGVLAPGFLDIAELEWHARALRSVQSVTMPGLLQTESYARTLFTSVWPRLPDDELEARVEHRLRRATILDSKEPPPLMAVVHEAALRMRFGGRDVTREQLHHLLDMSERPEVTVRVILFANESFTEATQPVLYADAEVPQLDTVRIDSAIGGHYLDAEAELKKYRVLLNMATHASLDPTESRKIIRSIAREL